MVSTGKLPEWNSGPGFEVQSARAHLSASESMRTIKHTIAAGTMTHTVDVVCEVNLMALPMGRIVTAASQIVHVRDVEAALLLSMSDEDVGKD